VPIAVLAFDFDPLLRLPGDLVVRWQTLALAAVIMLGLALATRWVRAAGLRSDDLLYIAVAVVPGAVLGGRLGYGLAHFDAYAADPLRLLDPGAGSLDLATSVVGGLLAGTYVVSLLGAPIARWAAAVAVPLLVALGAGKLALVPGGAGQGLPLDAPWATAFVGPGPWGSLAPDLPSHPSQLYEGLLVLGWALLMGAVTRRRALDRPDGRVLLIALAGWALVRAAVSVTWRDPAVIGPFGSAGVLTIVVGVEAAMFLLITWARGRRDTSKDGPTAAPEPGWPEPGTLPRF
jgi:prolipoprotein diacylglyceryltransferase